MKSATNGCRRPKGRLAVTGASVLLLCLLALGAFPLHGLELEAIAPAGGTMYLRASDLGKLVPKGKEHPAYKLWQDARKDKDAAPFADAFWKGLGKSFSAKEGGDLDETIQLIEKALAFLGETLVCTYLSAKEGEDAGVLVLAKVSAKDYPEYLKAGDELNKHRDPREKRELEFLGETIEEEAPGPGDTTPSYHAFVSGVTIDSNSLDLAKRAVHNIKKGGGESLKAAGEYNRAVGEMARRTDVQVYISLKSVFEKVAREAAAHKSPSPLPPDLGAGPRPPDLHEV